MPENHEYLTWKTCLKKIIISGFVLLILTFISWIAITAIINPHSFSEGGHANAWPYLCVGTIIFTIISTLANLTYLLPTENLKVKFLTPGIAVIILFLPGDTTTLPFSIDAGLINFLIGFYHYRTSLKKLLKP
jgi:hypothetical protein